MFKAIKGKPVQYFLAVASVGFDCDFVENGRPAFHPTDLLKLFIYGYLNRIRSSRALERECGRNIELMWLLRELVLDHNTISGFRKENASAIKEVFRSTVKIARHFNLIGGLLLVGDGTKLRAQNIKKNNYNEKKIERHLEYIDKKIDAYTDALTEADGDQVAVINSGISKQKTNRKKYERLREELGQSGEDQISTSDPESRQMIIRGQVTEAYNVQASVDALNCLPIDYDVTNNNDSRAMAGMVLRASELLGHTDFTALLTRVIIPEVRSKQNRRWE